MQQPEITLDIAKTVREVGNKLFREGKTDSALQKYQSECTDHIENSRWSLYQCIVESIRYLDVHPVLPDNSPPELRDSFDALLAPLLLNSALAAIRSEPPSAENANIAVKNTTRALDKLDLNVSDKGMVQQVFIDHEDDLGFPLYSKSIVSPSRGEDHSKGGRRCGEGSCGSQPLRFRRQGDCQRIVETQAA